MSIALFGAPIGTRLYGTSGMNKDLEIKLYSDIKPLLDVVNDYKVIDKGDLKVKALKYPYLRNIDLDKYYKEKAVKGVSLNDELPGETLIEVVKSGLDTKLPNDKINRIMSINEIQSTLDKPTLIFKYKHWNIDDRTNIVTDKAELKDKTIINKNFNKDIGQDDTVFKIKNSNETIYLSVEVASNTDKDIETLVDADVLKKIKNRTKYFTPSGYKSLLQKIIRRRPTLVDELNAVEAAKAAFILLYKSPGSFVPDIQRFVSGKESAVKRLAVSIAEDSHIEDIKELSELLIYSLVIQKAGIDIPYMKLKRFCELIEYSVKTNLYYEYDTHSNKASKHIDPDLRIVTKTNGYLLSMIGSFQSDINLFYSMGKSKEGRTVNRDMPISSYLDHHTDPSFVYLIKSDLTVDIPKLFKNIWLEVSSYNPRKVDYIENDFTTHIRDAQKYLHNFKLGNIGPLEVSNGKNPINIEYTLPNTYISSIIGPKIFNVGRIRVMACIKPSESEVVDIAVTKAPGRDVKDVNLEDKVEYIGKEEYKNYILSNSPKGIKFKKIDDVVYYDTVLSKSFSVPVKNNENSVSNPLDFSISDPIVTLSDLLVNVDRSVISKVLYYLRVSDSQVKFPSASKDGNGVTHEDILAFKIVNKFALNNSHILVTSNFGSFKVVDTFLLREEVKAASANIVHEMSPSKGELYDRKERIPFAHQTEAIKELQEQNNSFIWIPVGMGKTYIICGYLASLNILPKYLIFTTPKSAFATIENEFSDWGFSINKISYNSKGNNVIKKTRDSTKPFINLIEHDQLRKGGQDLFTAAAESIFIIDEVHKTLAQTKRSDIALTLASSSIKFIALTGTPMINNDMTQLLNWFKLTVDYPINKNNFWIAVSSLISKHVSTGVKVLEYDYNVNPSEEENKTFNRLLGRSIGGDNDHVTNNDIAKAFELAYEIVTRHMVKLAIDKKDQGVFLVAGDRKHQEKMAEMLYKEVPRKEIGLITKDNVYDMKSPDDKGPNIIITTTRMSEGYTLTKLSVMITSVYFSNLATRKQLDGRINRVTQTKPTVEKYIVMTRLLDLLNSKYNKVASMAAIMKEMSNA